MKVKTKDLTGQALDWAVAAASGATALQSDDIRWFFTLHGSTYVLSSGWGAMSYHPSTNWAQGGQLIEREKICVHVGHDGVWLACIRQNYGDLGEYMQGGCSPLVAALRCYVASKLGKEVEIPDCLKV